MGQAMVYNYFRKEVKEMNNNTNCIFCDKPTSILYNCHVCNSCKTISNFSLSPEELFTETRKCINSIQQYIESISETLHEIESRHINHNTLSLGLLLHLQGR